jgi:hypothetical protein
MNARNYGFADSKPADKGIFALTLEAIADPQMQRAERELARQMHQVEQKSTQERDSEIEPFGGW